MDFINKLIKTLIIFFTLYLVPCISYIVSAQSSAVPFTLEDRDRIMQTQKEVASLRSEMNTRFESQQKEVSSLRNEMNTRFESVNDKFESVNDKIDKLYTLMYFMLGGMLALFGYIVWDRKTVTEPIRERTQSLIQTLREYAKKQPELADILRSHGLL